MASIEGKVGNPGKVSGIGNPVRQGANAEVNVSDVHGRYYEPTYQKTMYSGAITGQVTSAALATTYTGLCLSNPVGSSVNLVVNKVGYAFTVAFAAGSAIGLMTGYNASTNVTHTTPVTPRNQFFTSAGGGVALLDSVATLPTAPTLNTVLASGLTGAITTVPFVPNGNVDMEGSLIIPPGGYVAVYTSTASGAAAGSFSFQWEETAL